MAGKDIQESQQQAQGITIGTQGNADQPTPLGDDLSPRREGRQEERHIPGQDRSSATNESRAGKDGEGDR